MVWRYVVHYSLFKKCRCYCWIPKYFSGNTLIFYLWNPSVCGSNHCFLLDMSTLQVCFGDRWVSWVGSRLSWARSSYAQRYWWWPLALVTAGGYPTCRWWNRQLLHGKKLRVYWKNTFFLAKSHKKCRYNHHVPGLRVDSQLALVHDSRLTEKNCLKKHHKNCESISPSIGILRVRWPTRISITWRQGSWKPCGPCCSRWNGCLGSCPWIVFGPRGRKCSIEFSFFTIQLTIEF